MAYTGIHREVRLVQATFAEHLQWVLGWDSVYAFIQESFGPTGTLPVSQHQLQPLVNAAWPDAQPTKRPGQRKLVRRGRKNGRSGACPRDQLHAFAIGCGRPFSALIAALRSR